MKKNTPLLNALIIVAIFCMMALASTPPPAPSASIYQGNFSYPSEKDEVVKNAAKLSFISNSANPTIVLRVPHTSHEVLEEDKNVKTEKNNDGTNNLYDINVYRVIEKELLKGGFTVRDRALFEKVLGDKMVNDYSKIKELTETDFILELSNIQYVRHPFNSFTYNTTGRKGMINTSLYNCNNSIFLYGLKIEFRLIKVKENDFIGSFTYNYSPCGDTPCTYSVSCLNGNCSEPYVTQGNVRISGIRLIPQEEIERFVKASTDKLVREIMH